MNLFYSFSVDNAEKNPNYKSNNFKLTTGINDKFENTKPIIPVPIADLEYWKFNNFTTHSHINSQKMENYSSSGYNKNSFLNKNEYFIPEIDNTKYLDVPLFTQKLQSNVYSTNYPRIINSNQGISSPYNTGKIIEEINKDNGKIIFSELKNDKGYKKYLNNENNIFLTNKILQEKFIDKFFIDNYNINTFDIKNNSIKNNVIDEIYPQDVDPINIDKFNFLSQEEINNENQIKDENEKFIFHNLNFKQYQPPQENLNPELYSRCEIERSNVDQTTKIPYHNRIDLYQENNSDLSSANYEANKKFLENSLLFRNQMMETLMQKRNAEMWQLNIAPFHGTTTGK